LADVPLAKRKALLAQLVARVQDRARLGPLRYAEHIAGDGAAFLREACRLGIPGMLSRKADAPHPGPAGSRLLIPCPGRAGSRRGRDGFAGPTPSRGARDPPRVPPRIGRKNLYNTQNVEHRVGINPARISCSHGGARGTGIAAGAPVPGKAYAPLDS